jgi:hypothetical protein
VIPLFPELVPHLREVFEQAQPGSRYVITRCRQASVNLRTHLLRILKRASVQPWPRLFQNLRASRETELAEIFPLHVVVAWMGNSAPIAAKHYLQLRDEDFERAIKAPTSAAHNAAQSAHARGCKGSQTGDEGKKPIGVFRPVTADCEGLRLNTTIPSGDGGPAANGGARESISLGGGSHD